VTPDISAKMVHLLQGKLVVCPTSTAPSKLLLWFLVTLFLGISLPELLTASVLYALMVVIAKLHQTHPYMLKLIAPPEGIVKPIRLIPVPQVHTMTKQTCL
jgi:hypothetical protein